MNAQAELRTDPLALPPGTDPATYCAAALRALSELVAVMNEETLFLRSGNLAAASQLTARKTDLAQSYVTAARAIQHNAAAIRAAVPDAIDKLRQGHASLATQLAENLRVLASAKNLTEGLLTDVARRAGQSAAPSTYSAGGAGANPAQSLRGLSVNRAL